MLRGVNDNLEEQALCIFNEKIINADNTNWQTTNLVAIANFLNGIAIKKYPPREDTINLPALKIKELRQGFCDDNSDLCSTSVDNKYFIHNGDLIFSWSGSLMIDFWCGGNCILNQHLFKVTSKKYDSWFYYSWIKYHLEHFTNVASSMATTMGHIKRKDLQDAYVIIPPNEMYITLTNILEPICRSIIANRIENNSLILLRDTLLPKLMSGEIDVSNIEI